MALVEDQVLEERDVLEMNPVEVTVDGAIVDAIDARSAGRKCSNT